MKPVTAADLDKIIHERARLAIMSALAASPRMTFSELKDAAELTDGNLSVHSRVLRGAGYISIRKEFVGLKPRTTMELTDAGRAAFQEYLNHLEEIVKRGRKKKG
jgi:DNA-binding transcriptional ArsR family regulator